MKAKSFMGRLLLSYLVIALIPIFVIMSILINLNIKSVKRDAQKNLDSVTALVSAQMEAVWNTMSFISLDIVADDEFMNAVKGLTYGNHTPYEEAKYYSAASNEICSYSYTSASYNIVFFNRKRLFMTSYGYNLAYSYQYRLPEDTLEELYWLELVLDNYGQTVLLPVSDSVLPNVDTEALTLVRAVRDPGNVIGFLAVQIDRKDLNRIFEMGSLSEMDFVMLYGDTVICRSEGFPLQEGRIEDVEGFLEKLKEGHIVSSKMQEASGIRMIMTADMGLIYDRAWEAVEIYVLEGIGILALTLAVIAVFSRQMSRPLVALTRQMQGMTLRNLNDRANERIFDRYSETKILYHEFTNMRQRLDVMINNEIMLKTLQSRERLHYLQSQINPHFLYNTLNIIGIMGADIGDDRIYDSCLKLSELLKYAIADKNRNTVTFYEEFKNIRLYLELMKLRFEDRLSYEIGCEEELGKRQILRLVLQPFVENVFEHSLDAEHPIVHISVTGRMEGDRWIIMVEDSGAGMPPEELRSMDEEIRRYLDDADLSRNHVSDNYGIGVKNTLVRLYLYYGGDFSFRLENREDGGFRVLLTGKNNLPAAVQTEVEDDE